MARKDPRIEATEEELIDCMRIERRLPDRERSWLLHSTLRWPAMVRDQGDYPDADEPMRPVSRREYARWQAMFEGASSYMAQALSVRDIKLVKKVAQLKARGDTSGFGWDDVWNALGGVLATGAVDADGRPVLRRVTSDAMRKRYEAAIDRLAALVAPAVARDA